MKHKSNRWLFIGSITAIAACLLAAILPARALATSGAVHMGNVMVSISADSQTKAPLDAYRIIDTTYGTKDGDLADNDVAYTTDGARTAMNAAIGKLTGEPWDGTAFESLKKLESVTGDDATLAASALSRSVIDAGLKPSATVPSDGSSVIMPNGLYVLIPKDDGKDSTADASASVTPIMYLFDGNEGNVSISEKSSAPSIDKTVNGTKVTASGIGEELTYDVAVTLPTNYDAFAAYPIDVADVLDKGLTLDTESIKVSDGNGTVISADDGRYSTTVTRDDDGKTTLKVHADDLKRSIPRLSASNSLHVSYTASVNADAALGTDNPNENVVTLGYQRAPYDKTMVTSVPAITKTFAVAIGITKVDAVTKNAIDGARLSLKRVSDGKWWNGDEWVDEQSDFQVDGETIIPALGNGSYELSETHAPDGYKTIDGSAKIDVDMGVNDDRKLRLNVTVSSPDGAVTVASSDAKTGKASVIVADTTAADASSIRQTGDGRVTILAGIAIAAAAAAIIVAVVRRNRK